MFIFFINGIVVAKFANKHVYKCLRLSQVFCPPHINKMKSNLLCTSVYYICTRTTTFYIKNIWNFSLTMASSDRNMSENFNYYHITH